MRPAPRTAPTDLPPAGNRCGESTGRAAQRSGTGPVDVLGNSRVKRSVIFAAWGERRSRGTGLSLGEETVA